MIVAKKYHCNSVTKQRAHWSLKTRCGMLPSNGVDVMAELGDFFDESMRKRRRTKACGR